MTYWDMTPVHICLPLFKGTRNGRIPLSSPSTIRRQNTTATRGMPATGMEGGMNLPCQSLALVLVARRDVLGCSRGRAVNNEATIGLPRCGGLQVLCIAPMVKLIEHKWSPVGYVSVLHFGHGTVDIRDIKIK